jgi:hypothetical protein
MTLLTEPHGAESGFGATQESPPHAWHGRRFELGKALRVLAGVDEDLLDTVPDERARYTGLGGVVLGTATIAALSMWMAWSEALGGAQLFAVIPVAVWALFVLNLDRWLVSSSVGTHWSRRAALLMPRLMVAIVLGLIVAEPIVLRVFQTAVEQHIKDERNQDVANLAGKLIACNPIPNPSVTQPTPPGCGGYTLPMSSSPAAVAQELARKQADAANLQRTINAESTELRTLNDNAWRECDGYAGPGFTGIPGVGFECVKRRQEAAAYAATHNIGQDNANIRALNSSIYQLQASVSSSTQNFMSARDALISRRVQQMQANQGSIGLLERMSALLQLTAHNAFLLSATWLIRLFLVLIDCLPVLVKMMTGTTAYDRLVDARTMTAERVFKERLGTRETNAISKLELKGYAADAERRKRREEIDLDVQSHAAQLRAQLAEAVAKRTTDLLGPSHFGHPNGQPISHISTKDHGRTHGQGPTPQ